MDKARQIKFAKRKHIKQLKRNAKNKIGRQHRMEARIMMRQIRKAHADIPENALNEALGQPSLAGS
jgi:hypothetical protein